MTVAQFLWRNGRYDGIRQRPLFHGTGQHRKERTVVIDECSMLTMDDLLAVLLALDLGHVERLILVSATLTNSRRSVKGGRSRARPRTVGACLRRRGNSHRLIEGSDASFLYDLTWPEKSETARRDTNLFSPGIRDDADSIPYAEHLVHRTLRGDLVRSKLELAIANYMHSIGLGYVYERELTGTTDRDMLRPDFSFVGDVIIWEHLMLDRPDYKDGWDWKWAWFARNGYELGRNLFTTEEIGGLDMRAVEAKAKAVRAALA